MFLVGSWPRKGLRRQSMNAHLDTQFFVSTSGSTLALAVLALVTPAAFKVAAPAGTNIECSLQNISHATAILLFFLYAGLLVFQLKTHAREVCTIFFQRFKKNKSHEFYQLFILRNLAYLDYQCC